MRAKLLGTAAAVGGLLLWGASAQALDISITLQQTGGSAPAGPTKEVSTSGTAAFIGKFGNFNVNLITAIGSPISPEPILTTTTQNSTTGCTSTCTLFVTVTETGLTFPTGTSSLLSGLTWNFVRGDLPSNGSGVTFNNSVDTTSLAGFPIAGNKLIEAAPLGIVSSVDLPSTYSETEEFEFTCGGGACSDELTNSISTAVPEPASIFLLGSALVGMGAFRRRRRKAA